MIDESTPMTEVVAGLCRAEYNACYEFCRRQRRELLDSIIAGADRLASIAFELESKRPAELMAWKFPDAYEPFARLPQVLDAACEGRDHDVYAELADVRFADLAATASVCSYLRDAATGLKRYGHRAPDPQRTLF